MSKGPFRIGDRVTTSEGIAERDGTVVDIVNEMMIRVWWRAPLNLIGLSFVDELLRVT